MFCLDKIFKNVFIDEYTVGSVTAQDFFQRPKQMLQVAATKWTISYRKTKCLINTKFTRWITSVFECLSRLRIRTALEWHRYTNLSDIILCFDCALYVNCQTAYWSMQFLAETRNTVLHVDHVDQCTVTRCKLLRCAGK